jgi:hypothetical protein
MDHRSFDHLVGERENRTDRRDDGDLSTHEIGRQPGKPLVLIVCPLEFDGYVLAVDETGFA